MNKQTAVKLLRQHFSLMDIQSWMGDCSFIDKVAIEVYKELAAKSGNAPDDIIDLSTNMTAGRFWSTQAYKWAQEFVLAKLRFDNKPRDDMQPFREGCFLLAELVKLRKIKVQMDAGVATPEQQQYYEANRDGAWASAVKWADSQNG